MHNTLNYKHLIPYRGNLLLSTLLLGCHLYLYFLLPRLLATTSLWALSALPILLLTNTFWALIHEGIHSMLHPQRSVNNGMSRLLCVCFASPFRVVKFGHLLHHRFSRTERDRTEIYDDNTPYLMAAVSYYGRLLGGLFYAEILGPLLSLLPRSVLRFIAKRVFAKDDPLGSAVTDQLLLKNSLRQIRFDTLCIMVMLGLSAWCYGYHWPWLVLWLLVRGFFISFADNLPHYGTPLEDHLYAYNLYLPKWLRLGLLNFNLHRVHHHHPTLPWTALHEVFLEKDKEYNGHYFRQACAQLRGPLTLVSLNRLLARSSDNLPPPYHPARLER